MDEQNNIESNDEIQELNKKLSGLTFENEILKLKLRESESLQKSIIENSLDGTLIINSKYQILYANNEICRILDKSEDQLSNLNFLDFISNEYKISSFEKFDFIIKNKLNNIRYEFDLVVSGKLVNVLASISFSDEFESSENLIMQIMDISDIKEAERRQRQINTELEQKVLQRTIELENAKAEIQRALEVEKELSGLKSRFISMISHEYRTPLTVILTSSYLIEQFYKGEMGNDFAKFISKIRTSVNQMTQLLEDVLIIGKNESGKTVLIPQKVNIIDYLNDIIEEIKVIDGSKHTINLSYGFFDEVIISDEKNLKHIFQNLLTNACKYSPSSDKVEIDISELDEYLVISVKDFGIGVPTEDLDKLFESFHRATNVGTISGTGLGLSIVKKSVDLIYGEITVDSKIGEYTKFIVKIPKDLNKFIKENPNN